MTWPTITKPRLDSECAPNLDDYEGARRTFSRNAVRSELDGLPRGAGLNIAHEAIDRHAAGPRANHLALRWLGKSGKVQDHTYAQLRNLTNRFANVLRMLGVGRGDRVYALAAPLDTPTNDEES